MKDQSRILMVILVLALAEAACILPFGPTQEAPVATASQIPSEPTRTLSVLPTEFQSPVPATPELTVSAQAQPLPQPDVTQSPTAGILSTVVLKIDDFPSGFTQLDAASQQQIGVSQETLSGMFQGMFSQARPVNYFAFLNAAPDTYQIVIGTLFMPLTQAENAAFDLELSDPIKATQSFTSGLGGNAVVLSSAGGLGEKSIGFTFTIPADTIILRGDLVMVRRGSVVALVLTLYQDGGKPQVEVVSLATTLDGRLKDAAPQ